MRSNEGIGLVHTAVVHFDDESGQETHPLNPAARPERMVGRCVDELLLGNPVYNSSVMVRRSVLDEVGLCDTRISGNTVQDYDLWLRIAQRYEFGFVPEGVTCYRVHRGQGMWDRRAMLEAELDLLLKSRPLGDWLDTPCGQKRLAGLYDELAVAYLDHADSGAARRLFFRAFRARPSVRQLARYIASLLPHKLIDAVRNRKQRQAAVCDHQMPESNQFVSDSR